MAQIPESVIEEVRDRADIVALIGEVVQLKKRGRNWVGLCPFHPEKTPSFNVTPEKQMYYCFGCQAGGNAFTFLMEHDKLDFPSAVRALGERTGVEVPEPEAAAGPDPHDPLRLANRLAAEFYHRRLLESDDAAGARKYLTGRGVGRALTEEFLLGWAPESWDALTTESGRHGIAPEVLVEAGLAGKRDSGGVYDRFRGRIVFPIRTAGGEVVALSGRRLDDEPPKYLNSAETPLFTKGRTLFNLDLARAAIRRAGAAIVVEGNFDVVAVHAAGWRNVVAPLGTAFTPEHARVLRRYTATAYLAYDGDAAGQKAAFKAADALLAAGFAPRIARLPADRDPDTILRTEGRDAFEGLLLAARDPIDAKLALVEERVDLAQVEKRRGAIRRLMASVRLVPDPVTRALYVRQVADRLGVPAEALEREAAPAPAAAPAPSQDRRPAVAAPSVRLSREGRFAGPLQVPENQAEQYLLLHAVTDGRWLEALVGACRPEWFSVPTYAAFLERLAALHAAEGPNAIEALRTSADPLLHTALARVEMLRSSSLADFELSEKTFRESLSSVLEQALDRGVLDAGTEPSGDPLVDAVRRRELRRRIAPGRVSPIDESFDPLGGPA